MIYLNLDLDYFSHPKTVRLIGLLGKGAEVLPIRLWCYCGKYHVESGKLASYSTEEVEAAVGWWGKSGDMVKAMIKVGFLEELNGEYKLHDWEDHEGHLLALKERGKTAAKARWDKARVVSNATSNANEAPMQCSVPSSPSLPSKEKPPLNPPTGDENRNSQRRSASRRNEDAIPHWNDMIKHMDEKWFQKKKAKFYWQGRYFKQLKTMCSLYQPYGVMALWDLYINSDDVYAKNAGYSFEMFAAKLPSLVDDPIWKRGAKAYEEKLCGPIDPNIIKVLSAI